MSKGYLRNEVAKITGIKPATIQQYTDKGFVIPSVDNPEGRGTNRLYTLRDMVELLVCREMVAAGVAHKHIAEIMEMVLKLDPKSKPNAWLEPTSYKDNLPITLYFIVQDAGLDSVTIGFHGKNIKLNDSPSKIEVDMEGHCRCFIIDLAEIIKTVKDGV